MFVDRIEFNREGKLMTQERVGISEANIFEWGK